MANPTTIDAYLDDLPADQRAALQKLRAQIKAAAPGAEEYIGYGLAGFKLDGHPPVYFGAATHHCALYGALAFEESCPGQEQRAGAHGGDLKGRRRHRPDPIEGGRVVHQRPRAEAAPHHQQVDPRRVRERVMRHDQQIAGGVNDLAGLTDGEDVKGRAVFGPTRVQTRHQPRPREDFERPREVEHLDAVENQDADVSSAPFHLTWEARRV